MYENTFTEIASVIVTYNPISFTRNKIHVNMRVDDNRGGAIREYRIMVITGGFQPFDVSSILTTRSNM